MKLFKANQNLKVRLNQFNSRLLQATKNFKTAKQINFQKNKGAFKHKINYHSRIQICIAGIGNEGKLTKNQ